MVFRVRSVEEAAPLRRRLLGHAPPAGFGLEQPLPAVSLSARCGAWQIKSWASGEVRTHVSGLQTGLSCELNPVTGRNVRPNKAATLPLIRPEV